MPLRCVLMLHLTHYWHQVSLTTVIIATSAHRLLRLLAAVCAVGLLGGFAVGVWFLGESLHCCWLALQLPGSCRHVREETSANRSKASAMQEHLKAFQLLLFLSKNS